MDFDALIRRLKTECPDMTLLEWEPMCRHTTFRIGGPVRLMAQVKREAQLQCALRCAYEAGISPFVIGNGSNLLASDGKMDLFAVKTAGGMDDITETEPGVLSCGAGAPLARAARFAMERGLSGLEFAHGIPGTLGGGVVMNAGAYGGELKDVVVQTRYLTLSGETGALSGEEQRFSYRHSAYSDGERIVTGAVIRLQSGDRDAIRARMEELAAKRRASQPLDLPSGGSTFKRPKEGYAAALIDQCGLKGLRVGDAQVSEKHAGFVVNLGHATCRDVLELTDRIRETVLRETGIELELELRKMGV